MEEAWEQIEGYEGLYEVSNLGRVRSLEFRDGRACTYFRVEIIDTVGKAS